MTRKQSESGRLREVRKALAESDGPWACRDCSAVRLTAETLRVHRAIAHPAGSGR